MTDIIAASLYALIPVPALSYLALAVYLRERRFRQAVERNIFATVNGMIVLIVLGTLLGAIPGFIYLIQFISFWDPGPSPNMAVLLPLIIGGPLIAASLLGVLAFKIRRFFQRRRVPYYLAIATVTIPICSLAYLAADFAVFSITH